jgi:protein phosphatase
VEDREILDCVSAGTAQAACDRLIDLTLERGAEDNVTVIVVRYRPNSTAVLAGSSTPVSSWGSQ